MHPVHELLNKPAKTPQDKILLSAIAALSTRQGFSHMTIEQVWDTMAKENWMEVDVKP